MKLKQLLKQLTDSGKKSIRGRVEDSRFITVYKKEV